MAGIAQLISKISNDVVARMADAGWPPLVDKDAKGNPTIAVGRVAQNENQFAPRIVFIPKSWRWAAMSPGTNWQSVASSNPNVAGRGLAAIIMDQYGGGYSAPTVTVSAPDLAGGTQATATADVTSNGSIRAIKMTNPGSGYTATPTVTITDTTGTLARAHAVLRPTPQNIAVATQRPIWTEWHRFEIHVWGAANDGAGNLAPDPSVGAALDYDATQQLVHQVIASTFLLAGGVHVVSSGKWADAATNATTIDVVGHYAIFEMEIAGPVLLEPMVPTSGASIQLVPPPTQANPTEFLQPFDGSAPEQA